MSRASNRREGREPGGSDMTKFYMILGVVAIVGVASVGYSVGSSTFGTAVSEPIEMPEFEDNEALVALAQGVTKGDEDAPVTIIEFGDYQCPGCGGFALSVKPQIDLLLVQTGKAKFVFYDLPLVQIHANSFLAARAGRCAQDQGKFWEYHDMLFRNQASWSVEPAPVGTFLGYGKDTGLEGDEFEGCLKSDMHADVVSANMRLAYELGISGTPTIMVQGNGQVRRLNSNDFQSIQSVVDDLLQPAAGPSGN